jgi:hypothetical protein
MQLKCIITFKTAKHREVSTWKTQGRAGDHLTFAAKAIDELRKRQKRQLTIVGVMVHDPGAVN